jgi:hypothetical protein
VSRKRVDPRVPSVNGFWDFVALRQEAYWLKQEGKKSLNSMMAGNHWPNVFRELDKGTIYFQNQTRDWQDDDKIFASLVYRLSNRQQTFEALGGIPRHDEAASFRRRLEEYRGDAGVIFTGRHLTPSWASYYTAIAFLEKENLEVVNEVMGAPDLNMVNVALCQVPGMGPFLAWQVTCDLLESGTFNTFTENDWCYVGPGPRNAMKMLLNNTAVSQQECLKRLRWLHERQHKFLKQGSIPFRFPDGLSEITLKNLEHAMCEYYRWVVAHWKAES